MNPNDNFTIASADLTGRLPEMLANEDSRNPSRLQVVLLDGTSKEATCTINSISRSMFDLNNIDTQLGFDILAAWWSGGIKSMTLQAFGHAFDVSPREANVSVYGVFANTCCMSVMMSD